MTMLFRLVALTLASAALWLCAAPRADAGLGSYLRGYHLGIDYTWSSGDFAVIGYETDSPTAEEESCPDMNGRGRRRCYAVVSSRPQEATYVGPLNLNNLSVFLEQPFKRQGFFYFSLDAAISLHTFDGGAYRSATTTSSGSSTPYNAVTIHAYGATVRPFAKIGITPKYFFDVFLSIGSGLNTLAGNYKIGARRENLYLLQRTSSYELEVVYRRFGDGYISSYASVEASGTTTWNFSRSINDHWIDSIQYSDSTLGLLKILLPF